MGYPNLCGVPRVTLELCGVSLIMPGTSNHVGFLNSCGVSRIMPGTSDYIGVIPYIDTCHSAIIFFPQTKCNNESSSYIFGVETPFLSEDYLSGYVLHIIKCNNISSSYIFGCKYQCNPIML